MVDTCDIGTGRVLQVIAKGNAAVVPFDSERARRKLARYLGPDQRGWDDRFTAGTFNNDSTRFVRLCPETLRARDLSYRVRRHPRS